MPDVNQMSGIFLLKRYGFYANILIVNTLTRKWLEYAQADLEAAVVLVKSGKTHYSYQAAVMHCHQAVEKMLKTLIVSNNEAPKRIHDLIKLVAQAPKHRAGLRYKTVLP